MEKRWRFHSLAPMLQARLKGGRCHPRERSSCGATSTIRPKCAPAQVRCDDIRGRCWTRLSTETQDNPAPAPPAFIGGIDHDTRLVLRHHHGKKGGGVVSSIVHPASEEKRDAHGGPVGFKQLWGVTAGPQASAPVSTRYFARCFGSAVELAQFPSGNTAGKHRRRWR